MSRLDAALAEIARRRELAQAATDAAGNSTWTWWVAEVWAAGTSNRTGDYPLHMAPGRRHEVDAVRLAAHIAANDPAHVLAVLDAAEATLSRHAPMSSGVVCSSYGCDGWPCPDAAAVLDLYAPEDLLEGGAS